MRPGSVADYERAVVIIKLMHRCREPPKRSRPMLRKRGTHTERTVLTHQGPYAHARDNDPSRTTWAAFWGDASSETLSNYTDSGFGVGGDSLSAAWAGSLGQGQQMAHARSLSVVADEQSDRKGLIGTSLHHFEVEVCFWWCLLWMAARDEKETVGDSRLLNANDPSLLVGSPDSYLRYRHNPFVVNPGMISKQLYPTIW